MRSLTLLRTGILGVLLFVHVVGPAMLVIGLHIHTVLQQSATFQRSSLEPSAERFLRSDPAIQWIEPGREFRRHGRIYDVVNISGTGSCTVVTAIADTEEEELYKTISTTHDHAANSHATNTALASLLLAVAPSHRITHEVSLFCRTVTLTHTPSIDLWVEGWNGDVPSPPPRPSC